MANIYTQIQRKLNQGSFSYDDYFLKALADENFYISDAFRVVRRPAKHFPYTHEESHTRYAFDGITNDGRMLRVILFLSQGKVRFKTAYEIFKI